MLLERLARTAVLAIPRPPLEARLKSVVDSQRRQRFEALLVEQRSVADDSEWLKEFEAVLDANREFEERIGELETENEGLRSNFAELAKSMATIKPTDSDEPDLPEPRTVAEAIDWIEELAGTRWFRGRVVVETTALDTGRAFRNYRDPAELARAVTTVLEAGVLFHDNKLGTTPMEFFAQRGFGYGAQPSPHLKVDEATGPDQCLRIYWDIDEATRTWRVSSIGRHA